MIEPALAELLRYVALTPQVHAPSWIMNGYLMPDALRVAANVAGVELDGRRVTAGAVYEVKFSGRPSWRLVVAFGTTQHAAHWHTCWLGDGVRPW